MSHGRSFRGSARASPGMGSRGRRWMPSRRRSVQLPTSSARHQRLHQRSAVSYALPIPEGERHPAHAAGVAKVHASISTAPDVLPTTKAATPFQITASSWPLSLQAAAHRPPASTRSPRPRAGRTARIAPARPRNPPRRASRRWHSAGGRPSAASQGAARRAEACPRDQPT